ncbi:hypothetical protein [Mucilaginibacter glaciei]|uniref:Uncharacterized protein n=1 Tax=Mucilaginibacter glaciei TaxID=2772109 RepID=A0A926NX79_9SPHI|nr:hypothetical protein [Mucilaginibacter glaciei]MBD1393364.1 hypothetical protein [Mucilaginibacter glaciei]
MIKAYYLPASRAIAAGIILVLMGLFPLYFVMLTDHSVTAGFQFFLETFTGFPEVMLGIIFLVILISGILYLKNARKILRLKLDEQGVYYFPFGENRPSKYKPLFNLFFLKEKLLFIAYKDIIKAELIYDKWLGDVVILQLKNGQAKRVLAATLSLADKKEITILINSKTQTNCL